MSNKHRHRLALVGLVSILSCLTNLNLAWPQEISDSRMSCGLEDVPFAGERTALGQEDEPVLGEFPVLIILVNFEEDEDCDCVSGCGMGGCFQPDYYVQGTPPGVPGEQAIITPAQAYDIYFGDDDIDPDYFSVSDFYDEVSYGRMQLTGAATGYYRLDLDLCVYHEGVCATLGELGVLDNDIKVAAITAAEDAGWDVHLGGSGFYLVSSTYEGVILAFPPYPSSWNHGGPIIWQNTLGKGVSIHELGHMIGLHHAASWSCGDQVWRLDDACHTTEYGNPFDIMGGSGHFNAASKRKLGWLDDGTQVLTLTNPGDNGIYIFRPLEHAGDDVVDNYVSALIIPGRNGWDYVCEFRQPLGYDEDVFDAIHSVHPDLFPAEAWDGLMVNRDKPNYNQTYLLDMTPNSQSGSLDFLDAVLGVGQTYTDELAGFAITPTEINNPGTEEAQLEVEVRFSTIEVDLESDLTITYGEQITLQPLISGGTPPYTCTWTPSQGLDDPTLCTGVVASPLETTLYTLVVYDSEADSVPHGAQVELEVIVNDCDDDGLPDLCEIDCGQSGGPCDLEGCGGSVDCQPNGRPDECDLADGTSDDFNGNGIPDFCDPHRTTYVADITDPEEDGSQKHPYDAIQEAIDDSISYDTIVVLEGYYTGAGNLDLDLDGRAITMVSESGPEHCTIDCEGNGRAFTLNAEEGSNTIIDGFTIVNGSAVQGGAIYLGNGVQAKIRNCVLTGNSAVSGGGIYAFKSLATISNCQIVDNLAMEDGGGIVFVGDLQSSTEGTDTPGTKIRNCNIIGNHAQHGGGLASNGMSGNMSLQIVNCAFAGNRATSSGGSFYCESNRPALRNCILWGSEAPSGHEITVATGFWSTCNLSVDYSDVKGGRGGADDDPDDASALVWGVGNINADPRFVDPHFFDDLATPDDPSDDLWSVGDYHLLSESPCIDAGDPDYEALEDETDIDGEPRIFYPRVDMGADEFHDCNGNGVADYQDIAEGTSKDCNGNGRPDKCDVTPSQLWSSGPPFSEDCNDNGIPDECEEDPCPICDLNGDGRVDEIDLEIMETCLTNPGAASQFCQVADLDGDGDLTQRDWILFKECYESQSGGGD